MFIWHELSQRETKQNTVQQIWRNKEDIWLHRIGLVFNVYA